VIVVGPILVTNVLSTALIAWKAWYIVCLFVSVLDDKYARPQGLPCISGRAFQKGGVFWACGETSRAFDRVRLRVLHPMGNRPLSPFDGSEQYTKWRPLQTLYLLNAFGFLVVSTSTNFPIVMLYISVRLLEEFVQVLNRPIICFQSTYPLIINVLAVTTQSGGSSGVWVQSVQ
jgi:hypothetical protein